MNYIKISELEELKVVPESKSALKFDVILNANNQNTNYNINYSTLYDNILTSTVNEISTAVSAEISAVSSEVLLSVGSISTTLSNAIKEEHDNYVKTMDRIIEISNTISNDISVLATNDKLGMIKIGYTNPNTDKNYAVTLNGSGQAYVYVPWTGGSASDVAVDDKTIGKSNKEEDYKIYVKALPAALCTAIDLSVANLCTDITYLSNNTSLSVANLCTDITYLSNNTSLSVANLCSLIKNDISVAATKTKLGMVKIDDKTIKINNSNQISVNTILSSQVTDITKTITDLIENYIANKLYPIGTYYINNSSETYPPFFDRNRWEIPVEFELGTGVSCYFWKRKQ